MKKTFVLAAMAVLVVLVLTACTGCGTDSGRPANVERTARQIVTVTDSNGNEVSVRANPTTVAIFDYSILDMLYRVGFERTGIELLIVPDKSALPDELAWFREQPNSRVITGGTLFYVNWDVLDLVQPDMVILGARSFGTNMAGDRLNPQETANFRDNTIMRYSDTDFVNLAHNARRSELLPDMKRNVAALSAIFPQIAGDLQAYLDGFKEQIAALHDIVSEGEYRALFVIMGTPTSMSIFLTNSRYSMIYDDFGFLPVTDEEITWTDQHGFDVRAEFVLETNPDVIFLLDRSEVVGTGAGAINFINDPIIRMTDAARNGHIYVLNSVPWYTITVGFTGVEAMIADISRFVQGSRLPLGFY